MRIYLQQMNPAAKKQRQLPTLFGYNVQTLNWPAYACFTVS